MKHRSHQSSTHRDRLSLVLFLLFLLMLGIAALSGRWSLTASSPVWNDGSQWHTGIEYGTVRVYWGQPGTMWSGMPPGVHVKEQEQWLWMWWIHIAPRGPIGFVQVPLWFMALLLLAWFVARAASRQLRLARGVCPSCGRATGGATHCPKCGRLMRRKMA